ncbi:MAG: acyloxyacyl hydrolase [Bacteroidota bacterium]
MRLLLVLFFCTNFLSPSNALQIDTLNYYSLRIEQGLGFLIKNYPDYPELKNANQTQASFIFHTNGKRTWHNEYNFPLVALNVLHTNNGNDSVLGRSYSFLPSLIFESKKEKRLKHELEIGTGFAYFTKFYNIQNNIQNIVIGSKITNATRVAYRLKYDVLPRLNIGAGVSFSHFSNGHYQLPNVGANLIQLSVFASYLPNGRGTKFCKIDTTRATEKKWRFVVKPTFGMHEFGVSTKPTGGAKYAVYSLATYFTKRTTYKHNWHLGIVSNHYTSFYDYIVLNQIYPKNYRLNSSTFSVLAGHEFIIGHFGLVAQVGIYLYNPFFVKLSKTGNYNFSKKIEAVLNNRLAVHYYFYDPLKTTKNKLFISLGIKANSATADYFDYGLGFAF